MMLGVDDEDDDDDVDALLRDVFVTALSGEDAHDKLSSWASRRGDTVAATSGRDDDERPTSYDVDRDVTVVELLRSTGDTRPETPPLSGDPCKPLHIVLRNSAPTSPPPFARPFCILL